jgi:3-methyladenine DNA glycosylase/8-oxoguanine DNA glycosylase
MNPNETPIQLSLPLTPWAQLVAPVLVARCSAMRALPVAHKFLSRYPTPFAYMERRRATPELVLLHTFGMFSPLGLASVRASAVDAIAFALTNTINGTFGGVPDRAAIIAIPGCGRYVADSFDLFYRGDLDNEPADPVLRAYRDETRRRFQDARDRTYRNFMASRCPCSECETERGGRD